ncbi:class IV aminotransferase [Nitritalea halalkaliphila LW7]|uniref:branched-chain-amino-acid transaminase n=1 Tax=Nitritalea halalkaliphila LW7 TaxID=1189621 RepID=I5C4E1_9BACT|nr:class IV aminotransferase [Nitritalea halalkaliphila LW7]
MPLGSPQLFIFNEDLFFPDASKYIQGVKLLPVSHVRAVATIKMTNYAFPVYLSGDWKATGAEDVLYYHEGFVSESSRSNIFIVKDGAISTPNHDILYGITRKQVIQVAENVAERPISLDELLCADEVFMTSTTKRILPVTTLADKKVNAGRVGPVTQMLMERFRKMEAQWIADQAPTH